MITPKPLRPDLINVILHIDSRGKVRGRTVVTKSYAIQKVTSHCHGNKLQPSLCVAFDGLSASHSESREDDVVVYSETPVSRESFVS